ncbi:hypothetical protein CEV31_0292 [Brucella thiophenivorans]|uniref:Uncharacterized protein n=1 Tax=Brucella thiophenivorans TaxID=571255 RepID=A0A256G5J8_9HYPH|nr:hypothetical protein CEV31_0292 [Brucella thiophenivorans]
MNFVLHLSQIIAQLVVYIDLQQERAYLTSASYDGTIKSV